MNKQVHIYSYIKAFSDVAENVKAQNLQTNNTARFVDFEFIPEDAIQAILESGNVSEEEVEALYEALDEKAIVMAKLDYYRTMEHFKQILAKNLEEGENITDFVRRIGEDELTSNLGIGEDPWYTNVVYRTNSALAYSAGKYTAVQANEQIVMLEFIAVEDNRTTDICLSSNGTTLPKDNIFWDSHWPPLHFQCRSDLIEYTQAFVDAFDINEYEGVDIEQPAEGFGGVEGYKNNDWIMPTRQMREDLGVFE